MALAGLAKTATWGLRLFQFLFAIILMGILSFMVHEFREFHSKVPREVTVPEVFSVLAVAFSLFSMLSVCFLNYTFQLVATFLDFAIWVGYLASAGLLHNDFHMHSNQNELRNALVDMRRGNRADPHEHINSALVKLLVALVVIQIILFFFTTILGAFVADRERREATAVTTTRRRGFLHRGEKRTSREQMV